MGIERITFSEERIPAVVKIIRDGIRKSREDDPDSRELQDIARVLESQCEALANYWDDMQSEE